MKKIIISMIFTAFLLMAYTCTFAGGLIPTPSREDFGLGGIASALLGLVYGLGLAAVTGMLLYLGVKYTMASANEKADLKNSSIKYFIGAIILLALPGVFAIIEKVMASINAGF